MKIEKLSSVKSTYKVLKRKAQDDSSVVSLLESARKRLKLRRSLKKAKRRCTLTMAPASPSSQAAL